ncbi:MAG: hypothetical protein ACTFAK_16975 [Candidatus Electronema sp. VV]
MIQLAQDMPPAIHLVLPQLAIQAAILKLSVIPPAPLSMIRRIQFAFRLIKTETVLQTLRTIARQSPIPIRRTVTGMAKAMPVTTALL